MFTIEYIHKIIRFHDLLDFSCHVSFFIRFVLSCFVFASIIPLLWYDSVCV